MKREYRVKRVKNEKTGQLTYYPQTRKLLPWWQPIKDEIFTSTGHKEEVVHFPDSRSAIAFIDNYRLYRLAGS
jgi:hypothetical protein